MFRCPYFYAGVALAVLASSAAADVVPVYSNDFHSGTIGTEWDFSGVHYGAQGIAVTNPTRLPGDPGYGDSSLPPPFPAEHFLGEFGGAQTSSGTPTLGDVVKLKLSLPAHTTSVSLSFDLYLLRTWDGSDVRFAGPDTFGYGYNDTNQLFAATFSHGEGVQSYCPGTTSPCAPETGADTTRTDRLGFDVLLDPVPGIDKPKKGEPFSLLYHMPTLSIPYSADSITFYFFSTGLQLATYPTQVADESWGIGKVSVSAITAVPEPGAWALLLFGLAVLAWAVRHPRAG